MWGFFCLFFVVGFFVCFFGVVVVLDFRFFFSRGVGGGGGDWIIAFRYRSPV